MTVDVYTGFDAVPDTVVNDLSVVAGVPFFKSIDWFRCLVRHGLTAGTPRLYVSHKNSAIICALYCLAQGRQLHSLSNFYTIEYGPVMNRAHAQTGLNEILRHISQERPRWTTLDIRNLQDADLQQLTSGFASTSFTLFAWAQTQNWYLDVAGRSFEQYYSSLASQLRNTLQRKSRKTEREHDLRLAIYPGEGLTLSEAISHYETIYAASWKEEEPFPGFMPALFRACDQNGTLRVGMAWVDGVPAATQIWINDFNNGNRRAIIYKLAYDQNFSALSIGSMLSLKLFQNAIDIDQVNEIDYGVGDDAYKRSWMSDTRTLNGLVACNRQTLTGQLRSLREKLSSLLHRNDKPVINK